VSAISKIPERVVIAIDPHKASWTAAVVDASSQPVATIRVAVSRDDELGLAQLRGLQMLENVDGEGGGHFR
jgi:hypothetical protein